MRLDWGLFKDCEDWEKSLLCNILLFENGQGDVESEQLQKLCLLALVAEGNGKYSINTIKQKLSNSFRVAWDENLQSIFDRLLSSKDIIQSPITKNLSLSNAVDNASSFFMQLDAKTQALIENIYTRYKAGKPVIIDPNTIKNLIREALSAYLKFCGLSFLNKDRRVLKHSSVMVVLDKLDETSKRCLAIAIGDTIADLESDDSATLAIWAKAFVLSQMSHIDPTLSSYRQQQLRTKSFVLDTDIVLYLLTKKAKYSQDYQNIYTFLKKLGCEIYVPEEVRSEVMGCLLEADTIMRKYGEERMLSLGKEYVNSSKRNVFVEDFIRLKEEARNRDLLFATYIGNYYRKESKKIFDKKLLNLLGEDNYNRSLVLDELQGEVFEKLKEQIKERTDESVKGQERSDEFNERASINDARIYMTLKRLNREIDDSGSLPYKYYLITRSQKTRDSAYDLGIYDKDIICSPQTLSMILSGMGEIQENVSIINLFENPFLAYVADLSWSKAAPLLEQGYQLESKDVEVLRYDYNENFNDLLTCPSQEEYEKAIKKYEGEGYQFVRQLSNVIDQKQQLERSGVQKDALIEEQAKKIASLEQALGLKNYMQRVSGRATTSGLERKIFKKLKIRKK